MATMEEQLVELITKFIEQVIDSKLREYMTEKNLRAKNLIIRGLRQQPTTSDESLVKEIFDVVQVKYDVKSIVRLGKPKPAQPLKIVMNSVEDKENVLGNLHRLKYASPNLRKIGITDDYTITERKEIKTWWMEAKDRTAADTDGNVWKVHGSPNSGLRLVRFKRNMHNVADIVENHYPM